MATDARRPKSETLSLRLDPKTRFMLDFVSRVKGQSITTVVEQAVRDYANRAWIDKQKTWSYYWDASEGLRMLKIVSDSNYPTNYNEDRIRNFTLDHWVFFYIDQQGTNPRRAYIDILWPSINYFMEVWETTREFDYWAAGEAMAKALRTARVAPPDWPPKRTGVADELENDIPF